jgi:hypothetical protein
VPLPRLLSEATSSGTTAPSTWTSAHGTRPATA